MTLPINLVLVRHGQSEGNVAKRLSEKGDHSAHEKLKNRHTRSYRLSSEGCKQATLAGAWLRDHFPNGFDRYYTSEYIRAKETAVQLELPGAHWFPDFYLSERDWGELDAYNEDERRQKFAHALQIREVEPFFWRPGGGETFMQLCLRADRVLETYHRGSSDRDVLAVNHGEMMMALRLRIERMSYRRFCELHLSDKPEDRIFNCEVIHYTRRNPSTGRISPFVNWMCRTRPTISPLWTTGWEEIQRNGCSNEDLREEVELCPRALS